MKRIFVFWIVAGMALSIHAQTITITDFETGAPLERATLWSHHPRASATTNAEGQVDISSFEKATNIEIRSIGYETLTLSYQELEATSFFLQMIPASFNIDNIVVSATRWSQSTSEVPSKIISISERAVSLQNPQTAADLLNISGQVFIQKSQQGGGSPMIRGFASNRLLYTVDGVRMNNAIFRGGNIQNVISLDPFATENTEVLFGPGSVIYGSDAIGGVMSFQTLTPQFSLNDKPLITGKAVARYSSANQEKTGHFDINLGWKKWALATSFSSWDYDHLRQGSNGPEDYIKDRYVQRIDSIDRVITQDDELLQIPSGYSQINLLQKVRFQPNEKWNFQYGLHYSETSPYGRYDRHNRTRNGTARYGEWNYGPQKWLMNNLTITHKGQNTLYDIATLRLAQQTFEESRISRNFNADLREVRVEEVAAYSANLDFIKNTRGKNILFYGIEYVFNDIASTGTNEYITTGAVTDGPDRYPQATWRSIAAYINDEWDVNDQLTLQAGARYNQFLLDADFTNNLEFYPFPFSTATVNEGALTGSIGGVFRPSESWIIKTNLGTAFRSPNVDDIGKVFDSEPGAVIVPNPDLKAEYAYNIDLGMAKTFGKRVKVDLTAFYTVLRNALVRRNFALNGLDRIVYDGALSQVQAIQNAAVTNVYGIQAGLELKIVDGLTFSTDLNYQVGEEQLEDGTISPSRHAAPFFGVTRLTYHTNGLDLQFYAQYQGARQHENLAFEERRKTEIYALDATGNTYAPGWYTLNLKAQYRFNDLLKMSTGIENITDQRYRPYSSGLSGPGRNFILSLQLSF